MAFHPIAAADDDAGCVSVSRQYAWIVFALTFGLLISDYMSRQVLNAVFPLLKGEWALSDGQLGLLSGIVALMVGLLTFPLSLMADSARPARWGSASTGLAAATKSNSSDEVFISISLPFGHLRDLASSGRRHGMTSAVPP